MSLFDSTFAFSKATNCVLPFERNKRFSSALPANPLILIGGGFQIFEDLVTVKSGRLRTGEAIEKKHCNIFLKSVSKRYI